MVITWETDLTEILDHATVETILDENIPKLVQNVSDRSLVLQTEYTTGGITQSQIINDEPIYYDKAVQVYAPFSSLGQLLTDVASKIKSETIEKEIEELLSLKREVNNKIVERGNEIDLLNEEYSSARRILKDDGSELDQLHIKYHGEDGLITYQQRKVAELQAKIDAINARLANLGVQVSQASTSDESPSTTDLDADKTQQTSSSGKTLSVGQTLVLLGTEETIFVPEGTVLRFYGSEGEMFYTVPSGGTELVYYNGMWYDKNQQNARSHPYDFTNPNNPMSPEENSGYTGIDPYKFSSIDVLPTVVTDGLPPISVSDDYHPDIIITAGNKYKVPGWGNDIYALGQDRHLVYHPYDHCYYDITEIGEAWFVNGIYGTYRYDQVPGHESPSRYGFRKISVEEIQGSEFVEKYHY